MHRTDERRFRDAVSKTLTRFGLVLVTAIVVVWVILPFYWGISMSFRPAAQALQISGLAVPGLSFRPTAENWMTELHVPEMRRSMVNSMLAGLGGTAIALLLGAPAAYSLARFRFTRPKNRDITIWFISQRVMPPVVVAIPFFLTMRALHLLDTLIALVLVNATFTMPFVIAILVQSFRDLPPDLEEAALLDGATHIGAMLRVAIPLVAPSLVAAGLIGFAFSWNEFLMALTLTSRDAITMPVRIASGYDTRGAQFWYIAVRSLLAMSPPAIVAIIAQRFVVRGLTLGAVRG
ncbi:carbohydrate ABC transporter permease [Carboxydochorda subterranea]|uniref:Carbohydrate ABC transporter permease n=1 Tax=Carboxydichorda subterranea TaxID=3109565 RepID=A0ABZ1BZH0_9FIRM|nr:carbohydrate ABC transporter permease [Limnochorda sp. L945t]WRP17488.1 carbohydrate ABC transporter permease [Limnochorda sp. L945t]